jgi:hypothetical protein
VQGARAADDRFAAAHAALKADPDVQFTLHRAAPPAQPPLWLKQFGHWLVRVLRPIGRFFHWIDGFFPNWPYARIFLWSVIGVAAVLLSWAAYQRIRHGVWRWPIRRKARVAAIAAEIAPDWAPEAAPAREWLREADMLAAEGQYAEAVHHLLRRSVDDIARRRPRLVRPALTSRELSAADAIPPAARDLFAEIARLVERSLFGGRPVGEADWAGARAAYSDFALARAWRA